MGSNVQASAIFNGYVGSNLTYHLYHEGIFELFNSRNELDLSNVSSEFSLSKYQLGLFDYGLKFGVMQLTPSGLVELTPLGEDLKKNVGFFIWMVGGYGDFFRNHAPHISPQPPLYENLINGKEVALGSRRANQDFMWNTIMDVLHEQKIERIADLGCGSGGALIDICKELPDINGIGIDINQMAISAGKNNLICAGLDDRIELIRCNVFDAINDPKHVATFNEVDTVISFMMMHDLFNIDKPANIISRLKQTFPNAKTFLIADTFESNDESMKLSDQMFSFGYEFVHHFQNIKLFQKDVYIDAFKAAGFNSIKSKYLNVPNTYLFILK